MTDVATSYTSKPIKVTAARFNQENAYDVASWCGGRVVEIVKPGDPSDVYLGLDVPSLSGPLRAELGDYVVRNERGVFQPQSPDRFEMEFNTETM